MTKKDKIKKVAKWIAYECSDKEREEEISWLLYQVYAPVESTIVADLESEYGGVLRFIEKESK
tara:strand:+ start:308 stop:496 length:189 start_codon:yes stop_codon:yes gene_type:complete